VKMSWQGGRLLQNWRVWGGKGLYLSTVTTNPKKTKQKEIKGLCSYTCHLLDVENCGNSRGLFVGCFVFLLFVCFVGGLCVCVGLVGDNAKFFGVVGVVFIGGFRVFFLGFVGMLWGLFGVWV